MGHLSGISLLGGLKALLGNIVLGWKRPDRDKRSSLLRLFVSDEEKRFETLAPGVAETPIISCSTAATPANKKRRKIQIFYYCRTASSQNGRLQSEKSFLKKFFLSWTVSKLRGELFSVIEMGQLTYSESVFISKLYFPMFTPKSY